MNTERTTERTGVMIPNAANAILVQTTWYTSPQKPDKRRAQTEVDGRPGSMACACLQALDDRAKVA